MDFVELAKLWGPLSIGWIVAGYLIKFIMDRYDKDIESRTRMATALEALTKMIERTANGKTSG